MKKIASTIFPFILFINPAMSQDDPLKSFQKIVSNCQTAFDARQPIDVSFNERSKKWVKRHLVSHQVTYDVRKTDSLVSPFSAVINLKELRLAGSSDTEQGAASLNLSPSSSGMQSNSVIRFAMQDGKWVFKSWEESVNMKLDGQTEFSPQNQITLKREPQEILAPRVSCLP